jgi:hypothetical protein
MKNTYVKKNYPYAFRLNQEEFEIMEELKEKYAINISGAFKMFLKRYLKVLKENDKNI